MSQANVFPQTQPWIDMCRAAFSAELIGDIGKDDARVGPDVIAARGWKALHERVKNCRHRSHTMPGRRLKTVNESTFKLKLERVSHE